MKTLCLAFILFLATSLVNAADFPPGWLPIQRLDDQPAWSDFRKVEDKVHLYLPPDVKTLRGVFVCFVFHSGDPRELARLWQFALVTVPWPFEYDLGHNDKRNSRYKLGHPVQDMGLLLRYLVMAAKETTHPELAVAPLVGWLGQNGSHLGADLHKQAPGRVLAWSDAFPNRLAQYPQFTAEVPFAYAWEFSKKDEQERAQARMSKLASVEGQLTPPPDFACRANTYGFSHGIYSKFNFFMAYLDRCIRLRLPTDIPPPGEPTRLKPIDRMQGWAGDYNPVGQWNPIAPAGEARSMIEPMWLPDEYAAWMWRSYHSAKPEIKLTAPVVEYRKKDGKWGGPECGLGYGGTLRSGEPLRFSAETTGDYQRVEFHSGDRILATADKAPFEATGVRLDPGLHALFAVGVTRDGQRQASRPAFAIVERMQSTAWRSHDGWIASVAFMPDGKSLISAGDDEQVKAWNVASKQQLWSTSLASAVTAVAVGSNGHNIAVGAWDGSLHLLDAGDGGRQWSIQAHQENVTSVAFSPDGQSVATGSGDDTLKVWDAARGRLRFSVRQGDDYDVTCVAFSPDGRWLVSGDGENNLKVWDSANGQELLALRGHEETVSCVAVSRDGSHIISGSWDDTLQVWDSRTGDELMTLRGHTEDLTSLACSLDGSRIVSGGEDGTVRVWDALDGRQLHTFKRDGESITAVAISPDGKRLVAGGRGDLTIWTMNE